MVGHRLVRFLSSILPTHAEYYSVDDAGAAARDRSQEQLAAVVKYLDQIALLVDKQEHEDFIRSVLSSSSSDPQGGAEQAEREMSLRDESYYDDGDDDTDGNHDQSYEQHSYMGGCSESTDILNNTTITSANTASIHSEQQPQLLLQPRSKSAQRPTGKNALPLPPLSDHDRSTISESVDVVLDTDSFSKAAGGRSNSSSPMKSSFLREDQASTPNHTILRVDCQKQGGRKVSPENNNDTTASSSTGGSPIAKSVASPPRSGARPFVFQQKWPPPSTNKPPPKPPSTSPFAARNTNRRVVSPQRQDDTSMTESLSTSARLETSEDSSFRMVTSATPSSSGEGHAKQQLQQQRVSPVCTVRSKVQAWPPKPDPPSGGGGTLLGRRSVPMEDSNSFSSSAEPSPTRPDRPSTPLPLEQHAIAVTSPESALPLLQQYSPDTVRRRFKPLTELHDQSAEMDEEESIKAWTDPKADRMVAAKTDSTSFSSSSYSSPSSRERDEDDGPMSETHFKYSRINSPEVKKVANRLDRNTSSGQDPASCDWQARHSRKQSDLSTSASRSYAVSASDWSIDKDGIRDVESASGMNEEKGDLMEAVSIGSIQFGSRVIEHESGEAKGDVVPTGIQQREADVATLEHALVTREDPMSEMHVSVASSQSKVVLLPSDVQVLNTSADSMGFPKPHELRPSDDIVATDQKELSGKRGQREADVATLEHALVIREGLMSDKNVSVASSQSKVDLLPSDVQVLDISTDSMGFPKPHELTPADDIVASHQQELTGRSGALVEPNYQYQSIESSVLSMSPDRKDTSTSSSTSPRNSRNLKLSGGSDTTKDMLPDRGNAEDISFCSVDFDVNTLEPLSSVIEHDVLPAQTKARELASITPTIRAPTGAFFSKAWSSRAGSKQVQKDNIRRIEVADAAQSDEENTAVQNEPNFGSVSRNRFRESQQKTSGNLDMSTYCKGAKSPSIARDEASADYHDPPNEERAHDLSLPKNSSHNPDSTSTSYAPSVADWSVDEGRAYDMHRRRVFEGSVSIDSMGFPAFPECQKSAIRDGGVLPSGPTSRDVLTEKSRFFSADRSVKGQGARSNDMVSAIWLPANGKPYATPQSLSLSSNHSQQDWPDVWGSRVQSADPGRERKTMLKTDESKSDNSMSSGIVHKEHGELSCKRLSQQAWAEQLASKGQNPSYVRQATDPFRSQESLITPGHQLQHVTSMERTVSTGSRSSTHSRELGLQGSPFPNTMRGLESTTTQAMYDPFSPSEGPIEAAILREEIASPFMIESKSEQRLKLAFNDEKELHSALSSKAPKDVALFGGKTWQFAPSPVLDLSLNTSGNLLPAETPIERSRGEVRRGNTMLCRKQKSGFVADRRSPSSELDADSASLLKEQSRNRQHFKNCFRFLVTDDRRWV